jgi:hypothetical protein
MMTLISTLTSFLAGGLPKLLTIFQDRQDKNHELALMAAQKEKELALIERGYLAQAKVEEIKLEQVSLQTAMEERTALYQHDMELGKGASQWVINLRASVRPVITYGMFLLLVFVDIAGFVYAWRMGTDFQVMLDYMWDEDTQIIWSSVIAFWFGTQAFSKK